MDLPQGAIPGAFYLCSLRSEASQGAARLLRCAPALRVTPSSLRLIFKYGSEKKFRFHFFTKHNFPFTPPALFAGSLHRCRSHAPAVAYDYPTHSALPVSQSRPPSSSSVHIAAPYLASSARAPASPPHCPAPASPVPRARPTENPPLVYRNADTPLAAVGSAESIGSASSLDPAICAPFSHCVPASIVSGKLRTAAAASPFGRCRQSCCLRWFRPSSLDGLLSAVVF